MTSKPFNVLFLCTGNSARSLVAEQLLNHHGGGAFRGFSAGSHPKGSIHPMTLELLREMNLPTEGLRSKSWDEFAGPAAPEMDFVFTVCDSAAGEACPAWPGRPVTAHWGVEDPADAGGAPAETMRAFRRAFHELDSRIRIFVSLPIRSLDRMKLERAVAEIGRGSAEEPALT